jgi:hypothetical protein
MHTEKVILENLSTKRILMWSPRRLLRLPIELRVALVSTIALFILNVVWAFTQASWKLDPGTATLCGAIIGLTIVGNQARKGFANLIRSQNNQAELDRLARIHQSDITEQAQAKNTEKERSTLLSALRAEIVGLHDAACTASQTSTKFAEIADALARQHMPPSTKTITYPTFDAPIYLANLTRIGLLGPSIGGDVVKVLSRTRKQEIRNNF